MYTRKYIDACVLLTLGIIINSKVCFDKKNRVVAAEADLAAGPKSQTLVLRIDYYT